MSLKKPEELDQNKMFAIKLYSFFYIFYWLTTKRARIHNILKEPTLYFVKDMERSYLIKIYSCLYLFFVFSFIDLPTITAFEKSGLKIVFSLEKTPEPDTVLVNMAAFNSTLEPMTDFLFQAAVPKVCIFI